MAPVPMQLLPVGPTHDKDVTWSARFLEVFLTGIMPLLKDDTGLVEARYQWYFQGEPALLIQPGGKKFISLNCRNMDPFWDPEVVSPVSGKPNREVDATLYRTLLQKYLGSYRGMNITTVEFLRINAVPKGPSTNVLKSFRMPPGCGEYYEKINKAYADHKQSCPNQPFDEHGGIYLMQLRIAVPNGPYAYPAQMRDLIADPSYLVDAVGHHALVEALKLSNEKRKANPGKKNDPATGKQESSCSESEGSVNGDPNPGSKKPKKKKPKKNTTFQAIKEEESTVVSEASAATAGGGVVSITTGASDTGGAATSTVSYGDCH